MHRFLWTQKQHFGPKPRIGHAMVYDGKRMRTVLFGGVSDPLNNPFNDTWEWDGDVWTQMADTGPAPRSYHAMAFDSSRSRTVLFGGIARADHQLSFGGIQPLFGDTWEWDGEDWTQLSKSGPVARRGHTLIYNSARKWVVLFGGQINSVDGELESVINDTWEFDGEEWTKLEEVGPSKRVDHSMAYDSIRNRGVLFGGRPNFEEVNGLEGLADTWEIKESAWAQTANFGPGHTLRAAMVFMNNRTLLFGGISSLNEHNTRVISKDSWEWDGKHWTQRQDLGPEPRWGHAMAYDTKRSRVVLFGGSALFNFDDVIFSTKLSLGDTWEHLDTSTQLSDELTIEFFDLSPKGGTAAEVSLVKAIIVVSGPAPAEGITIPLHYFRAKLIDNPPPDGSHLIALPPIIIPAGVNTGQVSLGEIGVREDIIVLAILNHTTRGMLFRVISGD